MFIAIVPAHNEEKNIGRVVNDLFGHVDKIVVVDDGSTDKTVELAKESGAVVISHEINRGQGAALQTGHDYALSIGAEYILHFDGDGQFDVADIIPAYEQIKMHGAHVLLGSRFLDQRSKVPFMKKYILFPLARIFHKVFVGLHLTDVHNGFRIFHREALQKLNLKQDRMAHATEIPAQIKSLGLSYIEFPVKVVYREYGLGFRGGVGILKDLLFNKFIR